MTNTQVSNQGPVKAYAGMNVESIKQKGTEAQKLAVSLFDKNKDGYLSKEEAENFNSYSMRKTEDGLRLVNRKEKQLIDIKYDNYEKDISNSIVEYFEFTNEKGEQCTAGLWSKAKRILADLVKGKFEINKAELEQEVYMVNNVELTITDADVRYIKAKNNAKINLNGVRDEGYVYDSPTEIEHDGTITINADESSEYDAKRLKKEN